MPYFIYNLREAYWSVVSTSKCDILLMGVYYGSFCPLFRYWLSMFYVVHEILKEVADVFVGRFIYFSMVSHPYQ